MHWLEYRALCHGCCLCDRCARVGQHALETLPWSGVRRSALRPPTRRLPRDHDADFLCPGRRAVLSHGASRLVLCESEPYGGFAGTPREPASETSLSPTSRRARGRENFPGPRGARAQPPAAPHAGPSLVSARLLPRDL